MSDKGFGDHANRNVVKNPLLSSAVTGLSLEDLTHKAVLLPAAPAQGLITRPEQIGIQPQTLAHPYHEPPIFPPVDARSNTVPSNLPAKNDEDILQSKKIVTHEENLSATTSKASLKSDDDFDVNEYFARLQGTRYVSAPLHSHIKDDKNANLDAAEENLEEINLNEPEKSQSEVQHSLTADIAQNFSQLPTVLPHVASAVFNSFSNMLSLKSREQTPDDAKISGYQEVQLQESMAVPLMGVDDPVVKDVVPPPKEPPIGGTGNYRITTKKKAYAQIPGLSTGDMAQNTCNLPPNQNTPFFTPMSTPGQFDNFAIPEKSIDVITTIDDKESNAQDSHKSYFNPVSHSIQDNFTNMGKGAENIEKYNIFDPAIKDNHAHSSSVDKAAREIQPNLFSVTKESDPNSFEQSFAQVFSTAQTQEANLLQGAPLIPPPPMFSNIRRDSQTSIGKSVLPPSVARRISANHPIIKTQVTPVSAFTENIFMPKPFTETDETFNQSTSVNFSPIGISSQILAPNNEITCGQASQGQSQTNIPSKLTQPPCFAPTRIPTSSVSEISTDLVPLAPATNVVPPPTFSPSVAFQPTLFSPSESTSTSISVPGSYLNPESRPLIFNPIIDAHSKSVLLSTETALIQPTTHVKVLTSPNFGSTSIFTPKLDHTQSSIVPAPRQLSAIPSSNLNISAPSNIGQVSTIFTPISTQQPSAIIPSGYKQINSICTSSSLTVNDGQTILPPTFFKSLKTENEASTRANLTTDQVQIHPPQFFDPNSLPSELVKPLPEPPKAAENLNYRMTKKRPQYYSGPIEGVGAISNNIKPILSPVGAGAFQGAMFTPDQQINPDQIAAPSVVQSSVPFDISGSIDAISHSHFDISKPQTQEYLQPECNTPFDFSRQTTESYEPSKEEPKGFGIIGSLKSKLSSLDINKIQHSVTTFFDPAYGDTNKDIFAHEQENLPIGQQSTYGQFYQSQGSNFEVFVPNVEQTPQHYGQIYDYQTNQNSNSYGQGNQYFQTQDPYKYYQNEGKNVYSTSSYYSDPNYNSVVPQACTDIAGSVDTQQAMQHSGISESNEKVTTSDKKVNNTIGVVSRESPDIGIADVKTEGIIQVVFSTTKTDCSEDKVGNLSQNFDYPSIPTSVERTDNTNQSSVTIEQSVKNVSQSVTELSNKNFFDNPHPQNQSFDEPKVTDSNLTFNEYNSNTKTDTERQTITESFGAKSIKDNSYTEGKTEHNIFKSDALETKIDRMLNVDPETVEKSQDITMSFVNQFHNAVNLVQDSQRRETNLLESLSKDEIPILSVSSVPLFGLSTIIADKSKEMTDLEKHMKNASLFEAPKSNLELFDRSASVSFFENIPQDTKQSEEQDAENVSELNICETCREFNKPEDRETDDLTSQLIENITSPIQLLNPVEVPLTEATTSDNRDCNVDSTQLAEISHITEETIETIHLQSAAELLDDDDDDHVETTSVKDYGWRSGDTTYPSNVILEHDYTFKIDSNSIGFFGNNSLFFDNVPNNASDEIKAELKNSQEDILPTEISIPSAPLADDDSKSDETGIDVHSIEQDAKKDFPFYEEFVIEPSETDDDKIEYKERERSSEDPIEDIDTFTNRVERFKKMEEVNVDNEEIFEKKCLFDLPPMSSPAISIASYFDTGNYAAETHYRNSISSPSSSFQLGSPNIPMRIPPGFEDEYTRKISGVSTQDKKDLKGDNHENIPFIPDTTTQTPTTIIATCSSNEKVEPVDIGFEIESVISDLVEEKSPPIDKLPDFALVFGAKKVEEVTSVFAETKIRDEIANIVKPQETVPLPDPINFFSSNEPPKDSEAPENFNRLASYFASPAKSDHAKSFFELSESQNHYRHEANQSQDTKLHKSILQSNDNQNNLDTNIPNEKYLVNLNLMKDLTSPDNIDVCAKDQLVRTVNYFTVEYDNNKNETTSEFNVFKTKLKTDGNNIKELDETDIIDEINYDLLINKCKYCCYVNAPKLNLNENSNYKVRTAVNESTESNRGSGINNMENNNDPRRSVTVNFDNYSLHEESNDGIAVLNENRSSVEYAAVRYHWFYRVDIDDKSIWRGFSVVDSRALEEAFVSPGLNESTVVATDGGRYDVNIMGRLRTPVYWSEKPTNVRRCSWFYKGTTDARYVPYTETVAVKLEEEYHHGVTTGEWHRRLLLPNNELVVMHGPSVMVHFLHGGSTDGFSAPPLFTFGKCVYRNPPKIRVSRDQPAKIDHLILLVHGAGEYRKQREKIQSTSRPRVVRRGHDESEIEDTEPSSIDHLLLLCHGVGSACDMRFRSVEEVVDDFRATSLQLVESHYRNSYDNGVVSRVEVLPISWHSTLHSGETGVDRRLAQITLDSIPRLRSFTNDTVLDVLFYTSPVYCQTIINTVCKELNRIYDLFAKRNPDFKGSVSLGGHSLGSVILYDLLCHQTPESKDCNVPSDKKFVTGSAGTGQPTVKYPQLDFSPAALYALGSPIAIFECIRGVESLGIDFSLPTCKNFFNIFHPYDPIAYRIEPLVNTQLRDVKPFLIPHHKGRKRMHLELKDTMVRVGADLKQKVLESLKTTWNKWKAQPPTDGQLEKVVEEEIEKEQLCDDIKEELAQNDTATPEMLGHLNSGRRVDYVLQEAPLEMINEYLFAMSSHVGYWESEDTMLLMLREIYDALGVQPDSTVPQQSLTVQRTRTPKQDEAIILGASEHPSTSRGST